LFEITLPVKTTYCTGLEKEAVHYTKKSNLPPWAIQAKEGV
jgi:hypothetical protein